MRARSVLLAAFGVTPGTDVDVRKVEDAFAAAIGFTSGGGRRYERETGTMVTIYLRR